MRTIFRILLLFCCLLMGILAINSCAPTTVYSDFSREINFRNYKSFAWLPKNHDSAQNNTNFDNAIVESNIKNLASGEMKNRGYLVNTNEPDLLMDFYVTVANKVDHVSTPVYGYPYNYNNYSIRGTPYFNGIYSNNNLSFSNSYFNNNVIIGYNNQDIPYEEGTLTIIIVDRKTNQLLWKGWSVGTVTDEQSFEYELPSDIRRLFKEFPVPVPKKSK